MSRCLLLVTLAAALWGCGTDCDDAAGKLAFCELETPTTLVDACDHEGALACQARCVRDTSCRQIAQSMAGDETDFDRCAATCGGTDLFAELMDDTAGSGSPEPGAGGAGGQTSAEQ